MAVAALTISSQREEVVDFTVPFHDEAASVVLMVNIIYFAESPFALVMENHIQFLMSICLLVPEFSFKVKENCRCIAVLLSLSLWYSHTAKEKISTFNLFLFNVNKPSNICSDSGGSRRYVLHISTVAI